MLLDADDAAYLVGALSRYCELLLADGKQPRPRLESLRAKLKASAVTDGSRSSCADTAAKSGEDLGHVIGTGDARRILGCTPSGARDLARRGKVRARFTGTRWFFDAADVERYAEARAERMER
ncbi:helix-turn-helix domain-containing protein [Mycobacterium senriense]|uniref:helix-turn-helix domain-containing protein n=1 Tax=Mycobacterium senriense TaxID=2775496 RepID=UPI001C7F39F6|nr:helix-turn-helix domain-containing protein [Mycobacterium senriense]